MVKPAIQTSYKPTIIDKPRVNNGSSIPKKNVDKKVNKKRR